MSSMTSRTFPNIQIFHNPKLLESLITCFSIYPTPNVMTVVTGITPNKQIITDLNAFATKLHDL